ncbi:MAG: hypothetical protein ABWX66_00230 [Lacisediminihabitans sp.]
MVNPFKIFVLIAVVLALALAVGFVIVVFFQTGAQPQSLPLPVLGTRVL